MEVETHPVEKGLKIGFEDIIELDDEATQTYKKLKMHEKVKESEPLVGSSSIATSFQLQLG